MTFRNKAVLMVGASAGMGRGLALRLASPERGFTFHGHALCRRVHASGRPHREGA